jgi:hypothetical protein
MWNLADTSKLYRHTYGTTDKLKSMDNSNFNKKSWIRDGSSKELTYTYGYILEKIVRRFNCTLLYRLYDDVLYVIILLYSIL